MNSILSLLVSVVLEREGVGEVRGWGCVGRGPYVLYGNQTAL